MALTQNEQLIIKHIGQNYVTKKSIPDIIPAYARDSITDYDRLWLSKEPNGEPLIPIQYAYYFVQNRGLIVTWTGTEYEDANPPHIISQEELNDMWN